MMNITIDIPYPIGTYVKKEENGVEHIDQIHEYILDKNGLSVILMLEVTKNPRLSMKIEINELLNKWNVVEESKIDDNPNLEKKLSKKNF